MGTDPGTSFVVMTYNIGNGMVRPARLVRCLIESGADVIGLQELDEAQAAAIGRETIERFPYQIVRGTGFSGRGLLSRFPIVGHEWLELSPVRPDLRVAVAMEGTDVTVVVAHPPPPRLSRRGIVFDRTTVAQIERLGEIVRSAGPAVLVGDLNMTSRHPMYARLVESGLRDAHRTSGAGRGATFPARPGRIQRFDHPFSWVPLPAFTRVDYIWHTPEITTVRSWVGPGGGSDHRPVFAKLALASGGVLVAGPQDS